ncbi:hypothetical protein [Serratia sp. JSRIV004]|uniref:hypothetical protein n=1 Tax=Serratia sp. JSRIV004 TaxID=2831895 RepID=UPI001CBE709A|nr:hypothetical protein [Serratia sp. JSRIV004]UAN59869.1 hypothetical protein KGP21_12805 [Serratia sp. JSRIV004]
MAKVTFCPHHIIDIKENITPEVIEKYFIEPLVNFLENAFNNELTVCVSQTLMTEFENTHPWRLMNDPIWKKWINDWYSLLKPLLSRAEILKHPILDGEGLTRCDELPAHINKIFDDFLDAIATHTLPNNANEEAIFIPTPWCANFNEFITIDSPEQIKFAKFTWYKIYPSNLPCQGEFPFVPPEAWRRSIIPRKGNAPSHGYIDSARREWIWDLLHKNHWDVQNPGGGRDNYTNVSPEGKVLDND